MNSILLILHFIGMVMALSGAMAGMVVGGLRPKETAEGAAALARLPKAMVKIEWTGLGLLVATGIAMIYTKHSGAWGAMPWTFWAKIAGVAVLVGVAIPIARLEARFAEGDPAAERSIQRLGPVAGLGALTALIFAVITFD